MSPGKEMLDIAHKKWLAVIDRKIEQLGKLRTYILRCVDQLKQGIEGVEEKMRELESDAPAESQTRSAKPRKGRGSSTGLPAQIRELVIQNSKPMTVAGVVAALEVAGHNSTAKHLDNVAATLLKGLCDRGELYREQDESLCGANGKPLWVYSKPRLRTYEDGSGNLEIPTEPSVVPEIGTAG